MKRAASFGARPTMPDVEVAATLLGYLGEVDAGFAAWRAAAVHGADHEYGVRRAIVDAVPDAVLRLPPQVAGAARRVPHVAPTPSRPLTAAVRLHA